MCRQARGSSAAAGLILGHWCFQVFLRDPSPELPGDLRAFGDALENGAGAPRGFTRSRASAPRVPLSVGMGPKVLCASLCWGFCWLQTRSLSRSHFCPHQGMNDKFCGPGVLLSPFSPNFACFFYVLLSPFGFLFAILHLSLPSLYCPCRLFRILFWKLRTS